MLPSSAQAEIEKLFSRYPDKKSVLLPALHIVQRELGYLSPQTKEDVARILEITPAEVEEVATFYTMYEHEPVGKYIVQVCCNLSCCLLGAESLLEHLKKKWNIGVGETTPDKRFTLKTVECLGSCGTAPVVQINDDYYENLTIDELEKVLKGLP